MKTICLSVILGLSVSVTLAQTTSPVAAQSGTNVPSQAGALRVNSPRANESITQNFIHVTYQLVNRGISAAPSPNFTIQLDGTDPVTTTAYDYTFTGLAPGAHTVTVTLVDANGSPIADSSVAVKFIVQNTQRGGGAATLFVPRSGRQVATSNIATPLPLLSFVGFCVLVGGICTAIRHR